MPSTTKSKWDENFDKFMEWCKEKYGATEGMVSLYALQHGFDERAFDTYSDEQIERLVQEARRAF